MDDWTDESIERLTVYFSYLDDLRASGSINMYAARRPLMENFGLDEELASEVWGGWAATFDANKSLAVRVALAMPAVRANV